MDRIFWSTGGSLGPPRSSHRGQRRVPVPSIGPPSEPSLPSPLLSSSISHNIIAASYEKSQPSGSRARFIPSSSPSTSNLGHFFFEVCVAADAMWWPVGCRLSYILGPVTPPAIKHTLLLSRVLLPPSLFFFRSPTLARKLSYEGDALKNNGGK